MAKRRRPRQDGPPVFRKIAKLEKRIRELEDIQRHAERQLVESDDRRRRAEDSLLQVPVEEIGTVIRALPATLLVEKKALVAPFEVINKWLIDSAVASINALRDGEL